MANPDSLTSAFRHWLAGVIDPRPPAGTAWCVGCRLNEFRTAVMSSDTEIMKAHAEVHAMDDGESRILLIASGPRKDDVPREA